MHQFLCPKATTPAFILFNTVLTLLPLSGGAIGAIIFTGGCSRISKSYSHSRFLANSMKFILVDSSSANHKHTSQTYNFFVSFTYTIYSLHNTMNIYLSRLWKLPTLLLIFSTTLPPVLRWLFSDRTYPLLPLPSTFEFPPHLYFL